MRSYVTFVFFISARILTKQFVLPFLLGIKFNMATLLPLVIGGMILLSKKALFLGKIALFLSSIFGFGSIFSLGSLFGGGGGGHGFGYDQRPYGGGGGSGYGGGGGYHQTPYENNNNNNNNHNDNSHLSSGYYKIHEQVQEVTEKQPIHDPFYDYERKVLLRDRGAKLYERDLNEENLAENNNGYRNFAWKTTK